MNFQNVQRTTRKKRPSASARSASPSRNEITQSNFTFRTREFEQMELEFFCKPRHRAGVVRLLEGLLPPVAAGAWGCRMTTSASGTTTPGALPLLNATTDFEFAFPLRLQGELARAWPPHQRYDLNAHQTTSGKDQTYFDQEAGSATSPSSLGLLGADRK